jgi:hypothetical protein
VLPEEKAVTKQRLSKYMAATNAHSKQVADGGGVFYVVHAEVAAP